MSDDDATRFDARALFRHLLDVLGGKPDTPYDWVFEFSHPDFKYLQSQMEPIADFFAQVLSLTPDDVIGSFDDAPTAEDEYAPPMRARGRSFPLIRHSPVQSRARGLWPVM